MATKKKKKKSIPEVPEAQMISTDLLKQPLSAEDIVGMYRDLMGLQQEWFPQMLANQTEAQRQLYTQMSQLQREQAPQFAQTAYEMSKAYARPFYESYNQLGQKLRWQLGVGPPPAFMAAYGALGKRISEGLAQGYELGPDLAGEIEQGIRASQTARGNYLGPALSAEEAFGRGQAALNLYNQRLGAAQNFLQGQNPADVRAKISGQLQNYVQGRNPTDIMGGMAQAYMGQQYYPQSTYVDPGLGGQASAVLGSGLQDYNRNYISAFNSNNEAQYNNYDRNFEQYLYNQAVQHGLYSMPQGAGGGAGMGGLIGGIGSAVGGLAAAAPGLIAL